MITHRLFSSVLLLAAMLAMPLLAEEKKWDRTLMTQIYGVHVKTQVPSWIEDISQVMKKGTSFKNQQGPYFIMELIEEGDSFDDWKGLWGIAGRYAKNIGDNQAEQAVIAYFSDYVKTCQQGQITIQPLKQSETNFSVFYTCASFSEKYADKLYHPKIGEAGVVDFHMTKDVMITIFEKWRGPAFPPGKAEDLVPLETVNRVIEGLKYTKLHSLENSPWPKHEELRELID